MAKGHINTEGACRKASAFFMPRPQPPPPAHTHPPLPLLWLFSSSVVDHETEPQMCRSNGTQVSFPRVLTHHTVLYCDCAALHPAALHRATRRGAVGIQQTQETQNSFSSIPVATMLTRI